MTLMADGDLDPNNSPHTLVPLKVAYKKLRLRECTRLFSADGSGGSRLYFHRPRLGQRLSHNQ
jgi:hypothetical protein